MGVFTFTMADMTSPVAPARLYQAFIIDKRNFMPKVVPEFVKSFEGESNAVGCIETIHFPDGAPFRYDKNKVEEIDENKCYIKYTTFEGDVLGDICEYIVYEGKCDASDNGTHFTLVAHFHTKGDQVMNEESLTNRKENIKNMFKAVEDYLIANPQVYS